MPFKAQRLLGFFFACSALSGVTGTGTVRRQSPGCQRDGRGDWASLPLSLPSPLPLERRGPQSAAVGDASDGAVSAAAPVDRAPAANCAYWSATSRSTPCTVNSRKASRS